MDQDPRYEVKLSPGGEHFVCSADQTILQAGLAQGIRLPHACRNGTCRACRCLMLAGEVAYRIDWPGLLREEKDEGWILPCVAEPRSALQLELPKAFALFSDAAAQSGPGPGSGSAG
jgi:ferredoxin